MSVLVLRRIRGLAPATDCAGRRLVQGPRPVTSADMGRDCCHRPHPDLVDGQMRCRSCQQPLVAAWHGEDNRIHSSVAGANDPLEFP